MKPVLLIALLAYAAAAQPLEIAGAVNPWRFISATGERGGVWGYENGRLEAWVYPLKIFHDFQLSFQQEGNPAIWDGDALVRTVRVYPHRVQLTYVSEQFTVTETLFAPRTEAAVAIRVEARTAAPLRVYARLRPDLNLMWPAAIGGQTSAWEAEKKWLRLAEPSGRFSAVIGSPAATGCSTVGYHAYLTPESPYESSELRLTRDAPSAVLVAAGGIRGIYDAPEIYSRVLARLPELETAAARHYSDLDAGGTEFVTPDAAVNQALRWARISLDQLRVCNPQLGCSSVSGYGSSGTGGRPMYAWFFDEPTVTSWAHLDYGGADTVREAFRFVRRYQRDDGRVMHEVSQSAAYLDWFKSYPYAYIHPDSPLWYLVSLAHFFEVTGDRAFLEESWESVRKAYRNCVSMLDASDGLLVIPRGEWGSAEVAAFRKDAAMAGEWIAALRAVRMMSAQMGDRALADECETRERRAADSLERTFWNERARYYDYGLDLEGRRVDWLNPMIGFGAWFGSLPDPRAHAVVERLASSAFLADWGQRNLSLDDPRYAEGSYTTGSVWPFMTAGALLASYRYHNAAQAFLTWTSMLRLRWFNARGAMPEVLSGTSYRLLDNAVPHQMFSELAVIPGFVQGVLGLEPDAARRRIRFAPHLPPQWPMAAVRRFPYGGQRLALEARQQQGAEMFRFTRSAADPVEIDFDPALPAGAKPLAVVQDGSPVPFTSEDHGSDVHVRARITLREKSEIAVRYQGGIALEFDWMPLNEGDESRNLRVIRTEWKRDGLELLLEGRPGTAYAARANGNPVTLTAPQAGGARVAGGYVRWTARLPNGHSQ